MTAFSKRQKGGDGADKADDKKPGSQDEAAEAKEAVVGGADPKPDVKAEAKADPDEAKGALEEAPAAPVAKPDDAKPAPASAKPDDAKPAEPKPPAVTAESPRVRQATMVPFREEPIGKPPEMPDGPRTEKPVSGEVEDPTRLPSSREIPDGNPEDPAAPPGRVPPGDSRSLRRGDEFALVYRQTTFVISRFGIVGQRGQWRVVEYPTSASASHSYAKECSRFVSEGFSDYRA